MLCLIASTGQVQMYQTFFIIIILFYFVTYTNIDFLETPGAFKRFRHS